VRSDVRADMARGRTEEGYTDDKRDVDEGGLEGSESGATDIKAVEDGVVFKAGGKKKAAGQEEGGIVGGLYKVVREGAAAV